MNNVKDIYACGDAANKSFPLFSSMVRAGLPTFGDGDIEKKVDLNKLLIKNPEATFFIIAEGNSMNYAGIHDGDILIVDRSLEADRDNIVISTANNELSIIPVSRNTDRDKIWGVVTHVIHSV